MHVLDFERFRVRKAVQIVEPDPERGLRYPNFRSEIPIGEAVTLAVIIDKLLKGRMRLAVFNKAPASRNISFIHIKIRSVVHRFPITALI